MQFKFNSSTPELVDLYVFTNWSAPWKQKSRQRIGWLMPVGFLLLALAFLLEQQYFLGGTIAVLALAWFLFYDKFYTNRLANFAKGFYNHEINERFWAEKTYTFKESHIHLENEYLDAKLQWKGIINIIERENAFWLFETLTAAHIIPKRVMDQNEQEEFRKLLAKKLNWKPSNEGT